ncbi:MAG: DUF4398 domain-containing protein [Persicimonas sp.]
MKTPDDAARHLVTTSFRARYTLLGTLAVVLLILGGCGPVQSTSHIHSAEATFERARVNDAHEKAPYEYYTAQNYLYKAKEEWGYSDFEASIDYAERAQEEADAAVQNAKEAPWEGSPAEDKQDIDEDVEEEKGKDKVPTGFTD